MRAVGDFVGGVAAYDAGKYTRNVMRTNAINAERDGAARASRIRREARLHMGRQVAGLAGSGFQLTGSALDAVRESAIEAELDIMTTQRGARSEADALRSKGELAYTSGYNQMSGGFLSGAARIMDFASDYSSAGG